MNEVVISVTPFQLYRLAPMQINFAAAKLFNEIIKDSDGISEADFSKSFVEYMKHRNESELNKIIDSINNGKVRRIYIGKTKKKSIGIVITPILIAQLASEMFAARYKYDIDNGTGIFVTFDIRSVISGTHDYIKIDGKCYEFTNIPISSESILPDFTYDDQDNDFKSVIKNGDPIKLIAARSEKRFDFKL